MNGDDEPGRRRPHLGRAGRGQRHPRQRRRRRLRHQHGRRRRQRRPEQPALRQPRERHQPLPHRRRHAARRGNLVVNNTIVNAADGRWCVNITRRLDRQHASATTSSTTSTPSAARSRSTPRAGRASSRDYNSVMSRFSIDGGDIVIEPRRLAGARLRRALVRRHAGASSSSRPGSDFHLLPGSPAVDAGHRDRRAAVDLDGNPRPGRRRRRPRRLRGRSSSSAATATSIPASSAASPASPAPTRLHRLVRRSESDRLRRSPPRRSHGERRVRSRARPT